MPVISVTEGQELDLAGQAHDVYEIVFTIGTRPGSFTVQVSKEGDAVAAAQAAIANVASEVTAIYGL